MNTAKGITQRPSMLIAVVFFYSLSMYLYATQNTNNASQVTHTARKHACMPPSLCLFHPAYLNNTIPETRTPNTLSPRRINRQIPRARSHRNRKHPRIRHNPILPTHAPITKIFPCQLNFHSLRLSHSNFDFLKPA